MVPARTTSPVWRFTPRRFALESRPLRELPPPFLCSIAWFLLGFGGPGPLGSRRLLGRRLLSRRLLGLGLSRLGLHGILDRKLCGRDLSLGDLGIGGDGVGLDCDRRGVRRDCISFGGLRGCGTL